MKIVKKSLRLWASCNEISGVSNIRDQSRISDQIVNRAGHQDKASNIGLKQHYTVPVKTGRMVTLACKYTLIVLFLPSFVNILT